MGTLDETITTIQAAFRPEADLATKQQAAGLLRSLLAVLEATPGMPLAPPASTPAPAASPPQADVLGVLLEKFRALLPANAANATNAEPNMPRLNIPLVGVPKR